MLIKPHFYLALLRLRVVWALYGHYVNADNMTCAEWFPSDADPNDETALWLSTIERYRGS